MADELQESTISLEPVHVRPLLEQFTGLIEDGFGAEEAEEIAEAVDRMEPEEEAEFEFSLTYESSPAEMRVKVVLDDVNSVRLHFFSPSKLAREIDDEMSGFVEDQGL